MKTNDVAPKGVKRDRKAQESIDKKPAAAAAPAIKNALLKFRAQRTTAG